MMARCWRVACGLLLAAPALAQPQVSLAVDPDGPVVVGTPVTVTVTVLVPTWMPDPPVWPDLQIADAITRLPERATHPVTRRQGAETWSGIARSWQIIPQRPADYDLGSAPLTITWADPDTSAPTETTLAVPEIAFSATVPPGAADMRPFVAATDLTVSATLDGPPANPKPGDAFTLTLATTAGGPPAMLLPPLAERLATPDGLRAYPHPPSLADGPPATRTEAVAFVIERPGSYVFPPLSVDWWNTAAATRATASTAAVTVDVPAPPGWRDRTTAPGTGTARRAAALLAAALAAVVLWRAFRRRSIRRPSERALYRSLRRSIRSDPPGTIRARLAAWTEAGARAPTPELEAALRALERTVYGPPAAPGEARRLRDRLVAEAARLRWSGRSDAGPRLPPLNPPAISARRMI